MHRSTVACLHPMTVLFQVLLRTWLVQLNAYPIALSLRHELIQHLQLLVACFSVMSDVVSFNHVRLSQRIKIVVWLHSHLVVEHAAALVVSSPALIIQRKTNLWFDDRAICLVVLLDSRHLPAVVVCCAQLTCGRCMFGKIRNFLLDAFSCVKVARLLLLCHAPLSKRHASWSHDLLVCSMKSSSLCNLRRRRLYFSWLSIKLMVWIKAFIDNFRLGRIVRKAADHDDTSWVVILLEKHWVALVAWVFWLSVLCFDLALNKLSWYVVKFSICVRRKSLVPYMSWWTNGAQLLAHWINRSCFLGLRHNWLL